MIVQSLLLPLVVAAISGAVGAFFLARSRASLERRIDFYERQELRSSRPHAELFAVRRVRLLARLHALDSVRGTAFLPMLYFVPMAGLYLFRASVVLVRGLPEAPDYHESVVAAFGFGAALLAAYCCLACHSTLKARATVVEDLLAGDLPGQRTSNPLEESRPVEAGPYLLFAVAVVTAPIALGVAAEIWREVPAGAAALLVLGVMSYGAVAFALLVAWREQETSGYRTAVSRDALATCAIRPSLGQAPRA